MSRGTYVAFPRDKWRRAEWQEVVRCGPQAGFIALYFMTAPNSNMAGIFEATLYDISRFTRMEEKAVKAAIEKLIGIGFCEYDWETQYIWDRTALTRFMSTKVSESQLKGLQNTLARLQESEEAPYVQDALDELERIAPEVAQRIAPDGDLDYVKGSSD